MSIQRSSTECHDLLQYLLFLWVLGTDTRVATTCRVFLVSPCVEKDGQLDVLGREARGEEILQHVVSHGTSCMYVMNLHLVH
jgi:hypothetical protein